MQRGRSVGMEGYQRIRAKIKECRDACDILPPSLQLYLFLTLNAFHNSSRCHISGH